MGQEDVTKQNKTDKWVTVILFLIIFPPIGLYYIWKDLEYFKKYLPTILLFCGGFYFVGTIIALTQWVPAMKDSKLNLLSDHFVIIIVFMILFSLFSIILSFRVSSIVKYKQDLPQIYTNIIKVCLIVILIIFPIIWMINKSYMNKKIFNKMEEIDKRHENNSLDSLLNEYSNYSVKYLLSLATSDAEKYYHNNENRYSGFCSASGKSFGFIEISKEISKRGEYGVKCNDSDTTFNISAILSHEKRWCIDNNIPNGYWSTSKTHCN
ncbi:MAG: hypothetical protein KAS78_01020 [Candidatus Pacebacteria bacterium]|nr:hypothetical protein [Candidatus Paceibacterota bacterium]